MCQTLLLQPLLVGCLLAASATMSTVQAFPQQAELSDHLAVDLQPSQTECPSCALLFSRVRARDGLLEQNVVLMERGEPKSGTGFMFEWAGGCLVHTCDYLRATFGEHSCSVSSLYKGKVEGKGGSADLFRSSGLANDWHSTRGMCLRRAPTHRLCLRH